MGFLELKSLPIDSKHVIKPDEISFEIWNKQKTEKKPYEPDMPFE